MTALPVPAPLPSPDFRCADGSFERDEPLFATASHVERWLLVEQSGPFSAESVPAGRLGRAALDHLSQLARKARARLVLIRRPRGLNSTEGLRAFYADVRPGWEGLATIVLGDGSPLTGLSLDDPGWTPVNEPHYLVCTHGKHDPCCAIRGRPVAAALASEIVGDRVWECSHIGGDRFAGNIVALPSGLYLGRVEPDEASAVVELIDSGRVPVHYLRGRSCFRPPVQAAQHFARTAGGLAALDAISDLLPLHVGEAGQDSAIGGGQRAWAVTLATPSAPVTITVRRTASAQPAQLTCHSTTENFYPTFEFVSIEH
jgi:Sucrase/ferredoxin-like